MNKRGQIKLSFGMIFSIILIIIFLGFAFFSVKKFIDISNSAQITQFKNNLQSDIDRIWNSPQANQEVSYSIPKSIQKICFLDIESRESGRNSNIYSDLEFYSNNNQNLFFYPPESSPDFESTKIEHINIEDITANENPFCISNDNGKINFILKKDFNEILVKIVR